MNNFLGKQHSHIHTIKRMLHSHSWLILQPTHLCLSKTIVVAQLHIFILFQTTFTQLKIILREMFELRLLEFELCQILKNEKFQLNSGLQ